MTLLLAKREGRVVAVIESRSDRPKTTIIEVMAYGDQAARKAMAMATRVFNNFCSLWWEMKRETHYNKIGQLTATENDYFTTHYDLFFCHLSIWKRSLKNFLFWSFYVVLVAAVVVLSWGGGLSEKRRNISSMCNAEVYGTNITSAIWCHN